MVTGLAVFASYDVCEMLLSPLLFSFSKYLMYLFFVVDVIFLSLLILTSCFVFFLQNMEAEKQVKFFQGCVAAAFAERDTSIMEVLKKSF
jgi:hypothetical protein